MNKYDPKELNAAIEEAISRGVKEEGMYNCLMFIPSNEQNSDGYIDAKRFGYNKDTQELDYLGDTDIMPWEINYTEDYRMDFVPGGINLFRKDRQKFKVSSICYCDTVIDRLYIKMEKNIVKNGTKVILFALDTEDTSVTGVITGHWVNGGKLIYECHYTELDGTEGDLDNLMRENFEIIPNKFVNLTPHTITLNNGTEYHPSGKVARVENQFSNFCCGISTVFYGEIENLPEPEEGTIYIVSAMVLAAAKEKDRTDVVAPATGHPDCKRENGFIVSVPGFVR